MIEESMSTVTEVPSSWRTTTENFHRRDKYLVDISTVVNKISIWGTINYTANVDTNQGTPWHITLE